MDKNFIAKFFLVVLVGVFILLIRLFWTYISAIVLGLLIASAFYPLYALLKRTLKENERVAAITVKANTASKVIACHNCFLNGQTGLRRVRARLAKKKRASPRRVPQGTDTPRLRAFRYATMQKGSATRMLHRLWIKAPPSHETMVDPSASSGQD